MRKVSSQLEVNEAHQKDYTDRFETFSLWYSNRYSCIWTYAKGLGKRKAMIHEKPSCSHCDYHHIDILEQFDMNDAEYDKVI